MIDQPRASHLASQAFDFWQAGKALEAVPLYEQALLLADPEHYGLSGCHGEYASVLSDLGNFAEARKQLEKDLILSLAQGEAEGSSSVVIARYFLAEHLLTEKEPQLALNAITPSMIGGIELEWLLRYSSAIALKALGRETEARAEALLALHTAKSDKKRSELAELLAKSNLV
ncbi:MAG: hypothetical protein EON49_14890 [Acidovorax sp.]|nr:MAG: hypothetical protein EON49_14890 [Acidovorax sp.]